MFSFTPPRQPPRDYRSLYYDLRARMQAVVIAYAAIVSASVTPAEWAEIQQKWSALIQENDWTEFLGDETSDQEPTKSPRPESPPFRG